MGKYTSGEGRIFVHLEVGWVIDRQNKESLRSSVLFFYIIIIVTLGSKATQPREVDGLVTLDTVL